MNMGNVPAGFCDERRLVETDLLNGESARTCSLLIPEVVSSHSGNNFDAIRLAMAMLVVWSHSFALHLGSEQTEWVSLLLSERYNAGNLGVMGFFVISGFLITQSWERSTTPILYFRKRVRRIVPGYLVATTLCAFVIAPMFGGAFPNVGKTLVLNLLLRGSIPAAFLHNPIAGPVNGSLWSIPYEFWCYIGVAICAGITLKRPKLLCAFALGLMSAHLALSVKAFGANVWPIDEVLGLPLFWAKIGPSFLIGMIVYSCRNRIPRSRVLLIGLIVASVLVCRLPGLYEFVVAPALAYAIFYVAFSPHVKAHGGAAFGDFSYGVYLYAFPIQQTLQALTGNALTTYEFVALSLGLSLLAGFTSWHIVEKRFLTHASRRPSHPDLSKESWGEMSVAPAR